MHSARSFTFGPSYLDIQNSKITCTYRADQQGGGVMTYTETLEFPGATPEMWEQLPSAFRATMLNTLTLMLGINYWKVQCAPQMRMEGFSLAKEQAEFWDTLYTKGLGEYFYRSRIDFRGLVSFPYSSERNSTPPTPLPGASGVLLLHGGGKDSIVSGEILMDKGIPFELFALNPVSVQRTTAGLMGRRLFTAWKKRDPKLAPLIRTGAVKRGYPSISEVTFIAVLAAALHGYRSVVLSNEQSSDIPNTAYLGLEVNHQWSKSSESERLIAEYLAKFITPDIQQVSLIRQYTEIEMVRRFSQYQKYFHAFSSCNKNFFLPSSVTDRPHGRAFWCNTCAKCAFMFACMSAFLEKETVLGIFGENLYANRPLLPTFKQLLGTERFKPFECVGTPQEMTAAMYKASRTNDYRDDCVMKYFNEAVLPRMRAPERILQEVLAPGVEAPAERFIV